MRVDSEIYKGIEYVRISNLPADQKEKISISLNSDKIIKIVKEGTLLPDCIQYSDYLIWFEEHHQGAVLTHSRSSQVGAFKFSIK
jgi:hypothetical protein